MKLKILPESFITTGLNISNSNNCLLCSTVLNKYKEKILETPEGCLFKITFENVILELKTIEYVNCIEFTAPKDTIIIPNSIYDNLFIDWDGEYYIDIDIFIPPQATKVVFKIENREIFNKDDVKSFLEMGIDKKYKFLQLGQKVKIDTIGMVVKELEPYEICFINNTDLEVEFDIPVIEPPPPAPPPLPPLKETIVNSIVDNEEVRLTRHELRQKRLDYYNKI
tara:strand:+ start:826 stop:1497 length:672 start_codon:yes stop_codon:yes gene_type:complete